MKLNRRTFIYLGTGVTLGLIITRGSEFQDRVIRKIKYTYAGLTGPNRQEKAALLAAQFPHLKFAEGVCEKYIDDFTEHEKANMSFNFTDDRLSRFLLSTDYVQNGGDSNREINYVVYYWPWKAACYNPYRMMVAKG